MKLYQHPDFRPEFPETFDARIIDNMSLSELAVRLQTAISFDFLTEDRSLIPGLRAALRQLSAVANVEGN